MDEPSGGTLRFSGHWILTNVFVTQIYILTSHSSILTSVKTSPDKGTLPYLFFNFIITQCFFYKKKATKFLAGRGVAYRGAKPLNPLTPFRGLKGGKKSP